MRAGGRRKPLALGRGCGHRLGPGPGVRFPNCRSPFWVREQVTAVNSADSRTHRRAIFWDRPSGFLLRSCVLPT